MITKGRWNTIKKGKVKNRVFHLFRMDSGTASDGPNASILIDGNDFINPIIWVNRNEMHVWLKKLDEVLDKGNKSTSISIYTYKMTPKGWQLYGTNPWSGTIEDIGKKNW